MTDETVDCFNCGSSNPAWAQVCRSCGVVLRHGETRIVPAERIPTDRDSLVSIAAVIGTIVAALVIGLFVSSLNPTDPTVGLASPSPTATPEPSPTESATPIPTDTPVPSATPVPLPGTIAFGTTLDGNGNVTDPTDTFGPGTPFAYSVSMPNGFGGTPLENEVALVAEDGTETIVLERDPVAVDPAATVFGYVIGTTDGFINSLGGAGTYVWRVYIGDQLVAQGTFTYTG
jgi:hypothetical protein